MKTNVPITDIPESNFQNVKKRRIYEIKDRQKYNFLTRNTLLCSRDVFVWSVISNVYLRHYNNMIILKAYYIGGDSDW